MHVITCMLPLLTSELNTRSILGPIYVTEVKASYVSGLTLVSDTYTRRRKKLVVVGVFNVTLRCVCSLRCVDQETQTANLFDTKVIL